MMRASTRPPGGIVVAVSGDPLMRELLTGLLVYPNDYDVIVVESIAHGYSRIKELHPDLVVVFMGYDDAEACDLLSMLNVDREVRHIPAVMCMTGTSNAPVEPLLQDIDVPLPGELWM